MECNAFHELHRRRGNASSSEKVNKLNQASWFWLLLPLSYFPLDEPQDVMTPLWYVRSQCFVSQHVFQSWHINVFWQTFELLPLWCDDPQPPLAGHQVVVQRLQQWCAEAAAPICRAKLGGGASSQTQGPLETFFLGDGRIGCGWNSVLGITVYMIQPPLVPPHPPPQRGDTSHICSHV